MRKSAPAALTARPERRDDFPARCQSNGAGVAYIELCKNSPTGIGGRGSSLKILSFSGKNQDGICFSLASSGPSSSPLFTATDPPYPTGAWTLGPAVLGAELDAARDGEIASGSPERALVSASGPCSVRALSPRSGSSFRAIRARSAFTGDICTTVAGGGVGLSIWPKK